MDSKASAPGRARSLGIRLLKRPPSACGAATHARRQVQHGDLSECLGNAHARVPASASCACACVRPLTGWWPCDNKCGNAGRHAQATLQTPPASHQPCLQCECVSFVIRKGRRYLERKHAQSCISNDIFYNQRLPESWFEGTRAGCNHLLSMLACLAREGACQPNA